MYRGFNLKDFNNLKNIFDKENVLDRLKCEGIKNNLINEKQIKTSLDDYLINNNTLDANKIINDWFPEVNAHVFLSHSHEDTDLALVIAGLLFERFKIITFLDSIVWGYSNELLKKIDNEYCLDSNKSYYDYDKRNISTTHVHLMLSNALNKMIDNCECIFFLNTPNATDIKSEMSNATNSPWIFSEIATANIIYKKTPKRFSDLHHLTNSKTEQICNETKRNKLSIEYNLDLSEFSTLDYTTLLDWTDSKTSSPENGLDRLYDLISANNSKIK